MATPYLTEDDETLLTEDGADTLILEQDENTSGTRRTRHMAALIKSITRRAKK